VAFRQIPERRALGEWSVAHAIGQAGILMVNSRSEGAVERRRRWSEVAKRQIVLELARRMHRLLSGTFSQA